MEKQVKEKVSPEGENKNVHVCQPPVSIVGAVCLFACKLVQ